MKCPQCSQTLNWNENEEFEDFDLIGTGIIMNMNCINTKCSAEDVYIFIPDWCLDVKTAKTNTKQSTLIKNIASKVNALKYG